MGVLNGTMTYRPPTNAVNTDSSPLSKYFLNPFPPKGLRRTKTVAFRASGDPPLGELTTRCARGVGRWGRGKTPGNGGVFFFGAAFVVAPRCARDAYTPPLRPFPGGGLWPARTLSYFVSAWYRISFAPYRIAYRILLLH